MGDSVGGDLRTEQYRFQGGYAGRAGRIVWGAEAAYRATLAYRQVDPRPTTSPPGCKPPSARHGTGGRVTARGCPSAHPSTNRRTTSNSTTNKARPPCTTSPAWAWTITASGANARKPITKDIRWGQASTCCHEAAADGRPAWHGSVSRSKKSSPRSTSCPWPGWWSTPGRLRQATPATATTARGACGPMPPCCTGQARKTSSARPPTTSTRLLPPPANTPAGRWPARSQATTSAGTGGWAWAVHPRLSFHRQTETYASPSRRLQSNHAGAHLTLQGSKRWHRILLTARAAGGWSASLHPSSRWKPGRKVRAWKPCTTTSPPYPPAGAMPGHPYGPTSPSAPGAASTWPPVTPTPATPTATTRTRLTAQVGVAF